jgi:hypothetical protein
MAKTTQKQKDRKKRGQQHQKNKVLGRKQILSDAKKEWRK